MPASGFRPLVKEPTTRWGRWLVAKRKERGWSQTKAFEELHEGLRLSPKSRTSYRALEEGRQPKPHEAAYLTRVFGAPPADMEPEPQVEPADMTALVAALDRQTEAISRLVSRLDVLASSAIREGVAEALREAEGFPGGGASQGEPPLSRRA